MNGLSNGCGARRAVSALALLITFAMGAPVALADGEPTPPDQGNGSGPTRGPHRPPPQAFEACQSKSQGDACSVQFHDQTITGTCQQSSDQGLFCRPDHMPGPPPRS